MGGSSSPHKMYRLRGAAEAGNLTAWRGGALGAAQFLPPPVSLLLEEDSLMRHWNSAESNSHQTASSANQSTIFAVSI
jgi:hypothetical protein